MHRLIWVALACSPPPRPPAPAPPAPPAPIDAAVAVVDAAPPAPKIPELVMKAQPWVFRYATADRTETWTLRQAGGDALLEVETARGTLRYTGSATEGATLSLAVSTSTAKMSLECKRDTLAVSAKCNDTKAKPVAVLNCFHPDFKAPMPFGHAPGIEYVVDGSCNGYRLRTP